MPMTTHAAPMPSIQPVPSASASAFTAATDVGSLPSAAPIRQHSIHESAPISVMMPPAMARGATEGSGLTVSFIAWIGGANAALRAGSTAPITATTMPTTSPTSISLGVGVTDPVIGVPSCASRAAMPLTMPQPSAMPATDPTRPSISAWMITVRNTCPLEAPIDRSSAYPRMDSRTIIEKVLAMMNDPTNSAITAKIRINGWMNPSISLLLLELSSRIWSPVIAWALDERGSALLMRSASSCCWEAVSGEPPLAEP